MSKQGDKMTEITFTEMEISEILDDVFKSYLQHYQASKMSFYEFAIIDNLVMKLQMEFKRVYEKKEGGVE